MGFQEFLHAQCEAHFRSAAVVSTFKEIFWKIQSVEEDLSSSHLQQNLVNSHWSGLQIFVRIIRSCAPMQNSCLLYQWPSYKACLGTCQCSIVVISKHVAPNNRESCFHEQKLPSTMSLGSFLIKLSKKCVVLSCHDRPLILQHTVILANFCRTVENEWP